MICHLYILCLHKFSRYQCTDHPLGVPPLGWTDPCRLTFLYCVHHPPTLACSLCTPSRKIYKRTQRSSISHFSTYLSAAISHTTLLYSTTLMFLAVNKAILIFSASFFYEVIHNTNRHVFAWFIFYLHTPIASFHTIDHRDDERDWLCTWYAGLGKLTYW